MDPIRSGINPQLSVVRKPVVTNIFTKQKSKQKTLEHLENLVEKTASPPSANNSSIENVNELTSSTETAINHGSHLFRSASPPPAATAVTSQLTRPTLTDFLCLNCCQQLNSGGHQVGAGGSNIHTSLFPSMRQSQTGSGKRRKVTKKPKKRQSPTKKRVSKTKPKRKTNKPKKSSKKTRK